MSDATDVRMLRGRWTEDPIERKDERDDVFPRFYSHQRSRRLNLKTRLRRWRRRRAESAPSCPPRSVADRYVSRVFPVVFPGVFRGVLKDAPRGAARGACGPSQFARESWRITSRRLGDFGSAWTRTSPR